MEKEKDQQEHGGVDQSIPVGKGTIVAVVVLAVCLGLSAVFMKLNLTMWIMWVPMAAFSVLGSTKNLKDIAACWISAAFAAGLAFLLKSGVGGTPVVAIGFIILILFIIGMVTKKVKIICNSYTGVFLACCTADGLTLDPVKLALSIAAGFLIFGMVPYAFGKLSARKAVAAGQ